MHRRSLLAAMAAWACPSAWPHGAKQGELYIAHPHAQPGGLGDLPIYLSAIRNGESRTERLLSARSSVGTLVIQRRGAEGRYDDAPSIDIAIDVEVHIQAPKGDAHGQG